MLLYPGELYRLLRASGLKKSFKIPKPKGVIRIRKSKDGQHNGTKRTKGQTMIYKTYT